MGSVGDNRIVCSRKRQISKLKRDGQTWLCTNLDKEVRSVYE